MGSNATRAVRFHEPGKPLIIEEMADPELQPGTAIVRVLAAFVPPYCAEMFDGRAFYPLPPLPFTPGMDTIGELLEVADDVSGLEVGERVFCDHFYNAVNVGGRAESCYIGVFGKGERSQKILARWRDGSFAEKMILPAECFIPLGAAASVDPAKLVRIGWFGTCYGAMMRSTFRPGHTVLINAATGLVGSAGVLLALALGAGRVVALGRRQAVLDELCALDTKRVTGLAISGAPSDAEAIVEAVGGGADILLDCIGHVPDPAATQNALAALAPYGCALFVGGCVGELAISYKWVLDKQITILGSSWYPREGNAEMFSMIGTGALDAEALRARVFSLDEVNEAAQWAEHGSGGLEHAALVP